MIKAKIYILSKEYLKLVLIFLTLVAVLTSCKLQELRKQVKATDNLGIISGHNKF